MQAGFGLPQRRENSLVAAPFRRAFERRIRVGEIGFGAEIDG